MKEEKRFGKVPFYETCTTIKIESLPLCFNYFCPGLQFSLGFKLGGTRFEKGKDIFYISAPDERNLTNALFPQKRATRRWRTETYCNFSDALIFRLTF